MPTEITHLINAASHVFYASVSQSPAPLLIVAGFASASVLLYGLTRGKEFLIAGYSSVLFLVPFIHLS
ncbi:MAG: hypothetical protein JWM57_2637 [Phycisphaerales bacterium]|nr:hypothetical protein [Phycisphaerales bacterium]